MKVYFWLIHEFFKNQKEYQFNKVFHRFSCFLSLGKSIFILFRRYRNGTLVLKGLIYRKKGADPGPYQTFKMKISTEISKF